MGNEITVYDKEKLFDNVYWFLCEQYTKGNPLHFLMFVGLDGELSYDMANYILHHRYYNGALRCIDYHSNEDIVKHLSQMHFGDVFLLNGLEKASTVALIPMVRKIEEIQYNSNNTCDDFGTLIINTINPNVLPEYIRKHFDIITLEPEMQGQANGQDAIPEGFLDDIGWLRIGDIEIPFSDCEARLIRYMVEEMSGLDQEYLELQHILAYLYNVDGVINKIRLSKEDRKTFDNDSNRINERCKKYNIEKLIKCLGEKRYTLSIKIKLSRNSQNNSQSPPYKTLKY